MKIKLLLSIAAFIIMCQCFSWVLAATQSLSGPVGSAIKKYKSGNYTGCLQDTQQIVGRDPSNAVAYYYMAMSYVQAGSKDKALEAYQKVLSLRPNAVLFTYATTGKRCIETPDKCQSTEQLTDIDKMVNSPYVDGLSSSVKTQLEQKRLQLIKNEINTGGDVNNFKFKQFKDFSNQRSQIATDNKIAYEDKMPSSDEIVAALKVLNKAGLNQYAQSNAPVNAQYDSYAQMSNPMMAPQNAESAQLSMLMGSGNQSNNNNNMMNMIPFMLAQSKNGQNNSGNAYSPQLMQSMLMNSMLPDFNFNTNNDK